MDNIVVNDNRIPWGKLAVGISLLLFGVLGLTDAWEYFDLREIWRYWPLVLIFIGVASEFDSLRRRQPGGGYIIAAIGVWMLFANYRIFGLSHRSAFPLGIAVVGLGIILHAIFDAPPAKQGEEE